MRRLTAVGRGILVAPWAVWGLVAAAQTVPPAIPTPADLVDRKPTVQTDPSRLPQAERPVPRQLARPDSDATLAVRGYTLADSAPPQLKEALARLTAPYTGAEMTFGDIADAAREVTRFLQRDLGYYLGLAYVPEQEFRDGLVRLEVLEGRLDTIELVWKDGLPVRRSVIDGYLAQLQPGAVLLVRDVERVVFLVNDLRGLTADFEVKAGRQPGTATLVVTPAALPSLDLSAEADNAIPKTLGEVRLAATVVKNSPFGLGDSLTGTLTAARGLAFGLASYARPLGSAGFRMGASVSALQYAIDKARFPQGLKGTATTVSVFGLYPFVRSRNLNLFGVGTLDGKSYRDFDGANTNPKRVVNASLGLTGDLRDTVAGGGLNSMDLQLSTGQIRFDVPPVGRDVPETRFTKLNLRAVRLQNILPGRLQAYGVLRAQKAFNNLDVTEQFRAGGPDSVRAFPQGEGTGDNGVLLSLELRALPPPDLLGKLGGRTFVALFVDWARVQKRNDRSGVDDTTEAAYASYAGWGLAAVWNGPDGWDLRASVATATQGKVNNDDDDARVRAFVQLSKRF